MCVKHSEFAHAIQAVFGTYASSLVRDLVLTEVGGKTAEEALAAGVPPRQVWAAICHAKEIDPYLWVEIRDTRK